jgi:hypothetical protein
MAKVTTADLAFIDAAIMAHKALQMKPQAAMVGVDSSNPVACDPVDVAALLVAAAIIAYKAWNSCMIGEEAVNVERAQKLGIAPTVSLQKLIASRNQLAKALHAPAID